VVAPSRMEHWRLGILERLSSRLTSDATKPKEGKNHEAHRNSFAVWSRLMLDSEDVPRRIG